MIPIRVDPELRGMAAPHAHAPSYVASPVAALARPGPHSLAMLLLPIHYRSSRA